MMTRFHPLALVALANLASTLVSGVVIPSAPLGFDAVGEPIFGNSPFVNETGRGNAQFGNSVALSATGTRLVVGSPQDDSANQNAGAVFLFELTDQGDWNAANPLWSLLGKPNEQIGEFLSLNDEGSRVAIRREDSVQVFDIPSGRLVGSPLSCQPNGANAVTGAAVALSADGDKLAIHCQTSSGRVELYELVSEQWNPVGQLNGLAPGDFFGFSLSFDGTEISSLSLLPTMMQTDPTAAFSKCTNRQAPPLGPNSALINLAKQQEINLVLPWRSVETGLQLWSQRLLQKAMLGKSLLSNLMM